MKSGISVARSLRISRWADGGATVKSEISAGKCCDFVLRVGGEKLHSVTFGLLYIFTKQDLQISSLLVSAQIFSIPILF